MQQPQAPPDFSEDDEILAELDDPVDREAFRNLMEHAHAHGKSAAVFIREDPKRTSRRAIVRLCLKNKPRFFRDLFASLFRSFAGGGAFSAGGGVCP